MLYCQVEGCDYDLAIGYFVICRDLSPAAPHFPQVSVYIHLVLCFPHEILRNMVSEQLRFFFVMFMFTLKATRVTRISCLLFLVFLVS